ncbi:MAG: helix-turn-helix transcriptional regulator [Clostridiales bacterium]|nr:helix-turn-helix transcriptional regulator [Clostridiales bacterium]NLK24761.1 helix-turn-helix transcriptional regulator [Clostridiales bacterium]
MEFNEKLQQLRKSRGLTQEELAEALYVSRTAISKWESGRGYPSIDSLKEISNYFSVTIDDLLSGDKLISIAEKENKSSIRGICDLLFGIVDLFSFILVVLPLYPKQTDGYIFSVNLFAYAQTTSFNLLTYWILFSVLIVIGIVKIMLTQFKIEKGHKVITSISMVSSILTVLFLALTREAYAITVAFLLLIIKGILLLKYIKVGDSDLHKQN